MQENGCGEEWPRARTLKDLQEFTHQSGLCQSGNDFSSCKGMASFQEASGKSFRGLDLGEKEAGFFPCGGGGTTPLHMVPAEASKWGSPSPQARGHWRVPFPLLEGPF